MLEPPSLAKGAFKYYVIKEVGGWRQKMEILDDLQYCKSSKSWVGGPKKVKNMMTHILEWSLTQKTKIWSKLGRNSY